MGIWFTGVDGNERWAKAMPSLWTVLAAVGATSASCCDYSHPHYENIAPARLFPVTNLCFSVSRNRLPWCQASVSSDGRGHARTTNALQR